MRGSDVDKDDEFQQAQDRHNRIQAISREDIRFLTIALNLSGKRQELEEQAAELIDKTGIINALRVSGIR